MSEKSLMCLGSIMYFFGVIMFGLFLLLGAGILLLGWWIGKRTENNC